METVYTKNVIEFVTVALEYCAYLEKCEEKKGTEFVPVMQKVLALLYLKTAMLEKPVLLGDADVPVTVTEADYQIMQNRISALLGENDAYFDGENATSVSENLSDIYQELKDFVENYRKGNQEVSSDSLSVCLDAFENDWGLKLLNCVKVLHGLAYNTYSDGVQDDNN